MRGGLTTVLGALLADAELRAECRRDPGALVGRWGLSAEDRLAVLSLSPDELEVQSLALVRKRQREVERLAPETFGRLGTAAGAAFARYAQARWPRGHRRHLEDALGFFEHLREQGNAPCCHELERLSFLLAGRRLAFRWIAPRGRGSDRRILQVLVRMRRGWSELLLGVVLPWRVLRARKPAPPPGPAEPRQAE
jgi:hypothetical protein